MTDSNDNSLVKKESEANVTKVGSFKIKGAATLQQRKAVIARQSDDVEVSNLPPEDALYRIGIVFDDSGSMYGSKITDAHLGTEEFIRSCDPKNTALSVYPMNPSEEHKIIRLTRKLYAVAVGVKVFSPTGGTPLFETLRDMLKNENLTRGIVFSDGSPNFRDVDFENEAITMATEKKIPVDTVFIGHSSDEQAVAVMKRIAEKTGGIFLIFDPQKSNFRTAFKYLSPGYRAMLADKSFVEKLQEGKI